MVCGLLLNRNVSEVNISANMGTTPVAEDVTNEHYYSSTHEGIKHVTRENENRTQTRGFLLGEFIDFWTESSIAFGVGLFVLIACMHLAQGLHVMLSQTLLTSASEHHHGLFMVPFVRMHRKTTAVFLTRGSVFNAITLHENFTKAF